MGSSVHEHMWARHAVLRINSYKTFTTYSVHIVNCHLKQRLLEVSVRVIRQTDENMHPKLGRCHIGLVKPKDDTEKYRSYLCNLGEFSRCVVKKT